jgi:hypothetical protein
MHIWDYRKVSDENTPETIRFRLERLINFGLEPGETIPKQELIEHFDDLKIDPDRKTYLKFLLWEK